MADDGCVVLVLLYISFLFASVCGDISEDNGGNYRCNVILLGATGDLAKRYLWQGFFDLYLSVQNSDPLVTFRFYGAARVDNDKGKDILENILHTSIKCSEDFCSEKKAAFIKHCAYMRLKFEEDYERLQSHLESSLEVGEREFGRVFYLSVPPFSYEDISRNIHAKCRPKSEHIWVKVVLEKPFGSDMKTALDLSQKLSKYWAEREIYRIDHYLGKAGVRQITEFRNKNRQMYEKIWNKDFIEQVKIVVKEEGDAKGRLRFYDHYGVIRDMFQNHLTEILVLVASDLADNDLNATNVKLNKAALLKSLRPVTVHDGVFGQYVHYNEQLQNEISGKNHYEKSDTPTFSALLMHVDNFRWFGVPFVLISGKSLNARLAYVHVRFKRNTFCTGGNLEYSHKDCRPKDIIFHIQGGDLNYPATIVSESLPKVDLPSGWENVHLIVNSSTLRDDHFVIKPPSLSGAYSTLINDVYLGNKDVFVDIEDLLLSWKVWTPLLEKSSLILPRPYTADKVDDLDFEIMNGRIKFLTEGATTVCKESNTVQHNKYQDNNLDSSHSFRGNKLVSGTAFDVTQKLASDITVSAQTKVKTEGVFHLALPGGSSPTQLFWILAHGLEIFPWEHTHVWVVDERCESLTHDQSNFRSIYENLLKYLGTPFTNIHPMPVDIAGQLCREKDGGSKLYEQLLKHHVEDGILDFIVLGVGRDGHTASLFPHQIPLQSSGWIELTNDNNSIGLSRMTMTFPLINRSRNIAFLILGQSKMNIVSKLAEGVVDIDRMPVTGVKPLNGSLTWYIDEEALQP